MKLSIDLISAYRSQIMGFAILWVMLSHFPIPCGNNEILTFFQYIGFGGVELFMLVSGFGLFFALKKSKSLNEYYKRRLIRILPVWIFCIILLYFFCNEEPFLSINFLRRIGQCWWFIPFILIIYLISPIIYKAVLADKPWPLIIIISGILFLQICYKLSGFSNIMITLFFARFFDFVLGMWLAKLKFTEVKLNAYLVILFGILGISLVYCLWKEYILPGFWEIHYDLRLYPMILVGPFLAYIVIGVSSLSKFISHPLKIIGDCSLEIYLLHVLLWWIVREDHLLAWYQFYPISLLLSYLLHILNKKVSVYILNWLSND